MKDLDITEADVREGLLRDEFFLEYMPVVSLVERKCMGTEALIRWRRPTGVVPPGLFIPLIEGTPVSGLVTYWVSSAWPRSCPLRGRRQPGDPLARALLDPEGRSLAGVADRPRLHVPGLAHGPRRAAPRLAVGGRRRGRRNAETPSHLGMRAIGYARDHGPQIVLRRP
jgi:hypothetical protein